MFHTHVIGDFKNKFIVKTKAKINPHWWKIKSIFTLQLLNFIIIIKNEILLYKASQS